MNNILLVEDSPNDAALVLAAMKQKNKQYKVIVATHGNEALDFLFCRGEFQTRVQDQPWFVLLDLKMPGVDGFEVLRQIRADPKLKFLPVVIFTSSREARDVQASYRLGANAYVVKPIEYQELLEAVQVIETFWTKINEEVTETFHHPGPTRLAASAVL